MPCRLCFLMGALTRESLPNGVFHSNRSATEELAISMLTHMLLRTRLFVVVLAALAGCSRSPGRYVPPKFDPVKLGAQAIAAWDVDGNQLLDAKELAACPALLADLKKLDSDKDERLSAAEIGAKVEEWTRGGVGAVMMVCTVTRGGQPAPGVQVKFIPEACMGDLVKPGTGVTDSGGGTEITAEGQKMTGVMQSGYYRVELSLTKDGKETIPAKFNTHTVLGAEVRPKLEVALVFDIGK